MRMHTIHYSNFDVINPLPGLNSDEVLTGGARDAARTGGRMQGPGALSSDSRIAKCAECDISGWRCPMDGKCAAGLSLVLAMGVYLSAAHADPTRHDIAAPASVRPFTAKTAGEFAKDCINNDASCADAIGKSLMDKISFASTSRICLPGTDYAPAVVQWLNAHPETASMRAEDGIFLALKTVYACGGPNDR